MSLAVHRLLGNGEPSSADIDRFLQQHSVPIVEGAWVTFLFRGEADAVNLRHFIFGLPSSQPLERVAGTDLWYRVMNLPECSRVEYKIEHLQDDKRQLIMDPLNPNLAHDPYGANSVAYGQGYETPDWTEPDPQARAGLVETHPLASAVFGDVRQVAVYVPPRFRRRRRYPLLVVHDGNDYVRYAELKVVLDNLIHRLEIPPLIAAMSQPEDRLTEYGANTKHARHIVEELVPAMEQRYPLLRGPASRCLAGASFGGVATLHTAWSYPGFFGRLLLQSGSFAFSDIGDHDRGPVFDPVVEFMNNFRESPGQPTEKMFLSCGMYESLIYENRSLYPLLQATGMQVRYVEARDGHNWDNWRDRLREGLSWLFPGPLWMVYE